jgi:putative transposase
VRDLIRRMSTANPLWGAPRIVGELAKIGIDLPRSTVAKYMARRRQPPSATWRAFLKSHIRDIVATDFFVVPTVRNQILFVFLILAHERRRVLHFNVTAYPSAEWTAQQIVEAFPWTDPPRYLLRDRDGIYGMAFRKRVDGLGMKEVLTDYFRYYHRWRTHLSLEMDSPEGRETFAADRGRVIEVAEVGGLHHHYERAA